VGHVGNFTWDKVKFRIGVPPTDVVSFSITGATSYFVIVMALNKLAERRPRRVEPMTKAPGEQVALFTEIADPLRAGG
jgi:large conductance mechanosensitive channel